MDNKETKLKIKVLEKLVLTGLTEKDLSNFGAKEFFDLYRKNKFSDREGEILLELIEAIKKKKLFSYLEVNSDSLTAESNKEERIMPTDEETTGGGDVYVSGKI